MVALQFILILWLGSDNVVSAAVMLLYCIGLWKLFPKSGMPGWHAFVPFLRNYTLARCADRELEGRVVCALSVTYIAIDLFLLVCAPAINLDVFTMLMAVFVMALEIAEVVYEVRVDLGLVEVYGYRKRWAILWALPYTGTIMALWWGFSDKIQPTWTVPDLTDESKLYLSGSEVEAMDEGLTVNLEERTAREFFSKKYLLRDIHLAIPPGHMVLLLGGSGAGKTTFVNAVNGYEKAKAQVVLNGHDVYKEYKHMQYQLGFVPQQELMRGKDTVRHTVQDAALLRLPTGIGRAERLEREEAVMGLFGLEPVKDNLVEKLSGGQKKRLSIAMEFVSNPSLFILDEPDSGLDGVMARELFEQLRKIADRGRIVIVITHTPDRVIDLFDDVIVLAKDANRTGRLAYFGSVNGARAFFGRTRMEEVVKCVNRPEEGGEGRADEFIKAYAEA